MPRSTPPPNDGAVLFFLLGLLLFISPFSDWWARVNVPWYLPFLLWGVLIILMALYLHPRRDDDD